VSSETYCAAFYVEKGGVGKTTSAAHVATAAAQAHDLDVLLLDLAGTQNDLATHFGIAEEVTEPDAPISAVFGDDWEFITGNIDNIVDRMVYATGEGPDLIPADDGLSGADNNLASIPIEDRYLKLDQFVTNQLAGRYDLVIFDLPGKEDNIALNGIFAAEHVIAPLSPGAFERDQLDSLRDDLSAIRADLRDVLETHDVYPELTMIIPTIVNAQTTQSETFINDITRTYSEIAGEPVAQSQNIANLQAEGRTLFGVAEGSLYATGKRAREAYRTNTDTLLKTLTTR